MRARRRWPVAVLLLAAVGACSSRPAAPACAPDALVARSLHDLASFTGWLDRHAASGVVGEVGWPAGPQWEALADRWAQAAEQADVGVLVWAAAER